MARTRVDLDEVRQRVASAPVKRPNHVRGVLRMAFAAALACLLSVGTSGLVSRNIGQIAQPGFATSSIATHSAAEAFVQWRLLGLQMLDDEELRANPVGDEDLPREPSAEDARESSHREDERQYRECSRRHRYV